jgi:hypothetical protein
MTVKQDIYHREFYKFFKRYYINYYFSSINRNSYFIMPLLINCQFIKHDYHVKKCNKEIYRVIDLQSNSTSVADIYVDAKYWLKKKIKCLSYMTSIFFKFYFLSYVDQVTFRYKILNNFNALKECFVEYEKLISN